MHDAGLHANIYFANELIFGRSAYTITYAFVGEMVATTAVDTKMDSGRV